MGSTQRLDANGNLLIQGELDEQTTQNLNIVRRIGAEGNLLVKELDEIATELDGTNIVQRLTASGVLMLKGSFDEVTKLEAAGGGGGGGDTNLQFNVTAGTLESSISVEHNFNANGTTDSNGGAGNGTWYNGTPTGSNFEIQIVVTALSGVDVSFEGITVALNNTSSWYTLNLYRQIVVSGDGTATIDVKIRQVAVPSNIITRTYNYLVYF